MAVLLAGCSMISTAQVVQTGVGARVPIGTSLEVGLFLIASGSGIPIGFESANVVNEKVANDAVVEVKPETVEIALLKVLGPGTKYEWVRTAGIIVVRPREGRSADLDRSMTLAVDNESLWIAGARIRDAFRSPLLPPVPQSDDVGRRLIGKKLTASGPTVREFLNDLIGKHGQAMWTWSYTNTSALGQRVRPEVRFRTFDGSMAGFTIGGVN